MSSITIRSARISRPIALETESSARWRRSITARLSRVCQATVLPRSIARCPSASTRCDLPGPARAADAECLGALDPLQRAQRLLGRLRDRRGVLVPGVEGLAGRQPRLAAAHPDRGLVAALGLFGQQDPQDLAGLPALRGRGRDHLGRGAADIGHPQPAQQPVELGGQRRRLGGLDRHAPKPSQARVERCSDCARRRARERDHPRAVVREDRGQVTVAEAPGVRGDRERFLDGLGAVQLGQRGRLGELAPQLRRPGRRGGDQPPLRARPDRRNACSSAERARGLRSSAPAGRGG